MTARLNRRRFVSLFSPAMLCFPLALVVPDVLPSEVRATLRTDVAAIVLGGILVAIGLAAAALFWFRRNATDPSLLAFGLFSGLYGLRLLEETQTIRYLIDAPTSFWNHFGHSVTYILLIPSTYFFLRIAIDANRHLLRWVMGPLMLLVILGVIADFVPRARHVPMLVNNILVILGTAVMLVIVFRRRQPANAELRALKLGLVTLAVFVFHENLRGLGFVPGSINLEPVGFLVFICCLGYIVALRVFRNQERLLAIQNELEIARQIQSSILPRQMPSIPGLEIAARYVPINAVAGDFYGFLVADGHRLGVLVADVSGHGVPAALIASMVKVSFSSQAAHVADPARVLSGMNQILSGQLHEQFVTAGYLFLDVEKQTMRYAGAGHPPLLLRNSDGKLHEFGENGPVLGLFPEAEYSTAQFLLQPGDRCLLYTDGILEATNASREFFGVGRFKQHIATGGHLAAGHFCDEFLETLARWSGTDSARAQEDDITLLVIDFKGSGASPDSAPV